VAALRAAGLKASVALLSTGLGLDSNPELPGLGVFDHAIVYVEGSEPLWIDATAEYTRVGDLPAEDQGRWALIATPGTTALVKTPESQSSDNRSIHTIEIHLADYGPSEIRESVESHGTDETEARSEYGSAEAAKLKETLEAQIKQTYLAESLAGYSTTRGDDFSEPFKLTVNAKSAGRAVTEEDQAVAGLFKHHVFSSLPYGFAPSRFEKASAQEEKPRTHDLVMRAPYRKEYRYRVFYPEFLKPKPLPKDQHLQMGPAVFTSTYRQDASGYVEAVFRFDTGKRRYTPAEVTDLRTSIRRIWNEKPDLLTFASATSEALALGKPAEALRIARSYAVRQPQSAAAQARLSRVLVSTGAGDSARASAQHAVELDAKSTQAWQALGWACQHDSFGRRFHGNWNPDEAGKAYRKAVETASNDLVPAIDLAILLEHNSKGDRYGEGSHVKEAVELYRAQLKKAPNAMVQHNLAVALLHAGDYDAASEEIKKLADSSLKSVLELELAALSQGADRAILDGQTEDPDSANRAVTFFQAAVVLLQMRQYDLAREFLKTAQRLQNLPNIEAVLTFIQHTRRIDPSNLPKDDPRSVVQRFYAEALRGDLDKSRLSPLFTKRETFSTGIDATTQAVRRVVDGLRGPLQSIGFTGDGLADIVVSSMDLEKEGEDDFGYRIFANGSSYRVPAAYVVKEAGEFRILATAGDLANVGKLVLELVQEGDLKSAMRWLDLTINGTFVNSGQDSKRVTSINVLDAGPRGDDSPAAKFLWDGLTEKARTASAIRAAAASLVGTFSASEAAIAILKTERDSAANRTERGNIDLALCQAYLKAGKWTELLAAAKNLTASYAVKDQSFRYTVKARAGLKQWTELEQEARAEYKASVQNPRALIAAVEATMNAGKPEKAAEYIEHIRQLNFSSTEEQKLVAWYTLLSGKTDDKTIEQLQKDSQPAITDPDLALPLGLLQVQSGKTEEARHSLSLALDAAGWRDLDARPWVLQGKIQDQLGNAEAAAAAYAEARKHTAGGEESNWALHLIPAAPSR
jgi:tetratricopeptide (TPR) repeat protein